MLFGFSPLDFQQFKLDIIAATGLAKDALHVYAGLAVFLAIRLLWRRGGGWILAWCIVLAMACAVEYIDILNENARGDLQPDTGHWHDIWNSMFWPTILVMVGPWLQPRSKVKDAGLGDFADQPLEQPPPV